jgi:eukaryotic-like serine/threonine-protein kinase
MSQGPGSSLLPFLGSVIRSELQQDVSYRLEHVLGEGGTAVAYYATRASASGESPAVVKIILPRIVIESGDRALTIVKKEAVALGRLNERVPPTPFVVRLMETGSVQLEMYGRTLELPWLAVEYVHGGALGTTLEARVSHTVRSTGYGFDPARAARAIAALGEGLSEIHAVGVIHRDLTPGNVLCCGSGESELFKISDFGIARPQGLMATFGDAMVGTPGYVAPEQAGASSEPIGPATDIFSLAGIIYFLLTGQRYFDVNTPTQALVAAGMPGRRSVFEAATLARELRDNEAACQAIDLALARATSPTPAERPRDARLFVQSLLPWLGGERAHSRPGEGWVQSLQEMALDATPPSVWAVRHPPGDDRLIVSAAWDAAGHCLAITTEGLAYWDGTRWNPAPTTGLPRPDALRFVRRSSRQGWLLGGAGALLAEYSREGVRILHKGEESVRFIDVAGDLADMAVVLAERSDGTPLLYGVIANRWLRPLPSKQAALLSSLARIDDERWLVVGRTTRGSMPPSQRGQSRRETGAFAAMFRPLEWELEPIEAPPVRALLACASRPERKLAVAVGAEGGVVRVGRDRASSFLIQGAEPNDSPDLASIAIDVLGTEWAAGAGAIWTSQGRDRYKLAWENSTWRAPFVSLHAESGLLVAMTVDGGILECRANVFDPTRPA